MTPLTSSKSCRMCRISSQTHCFWTALPSITFNTSLGKRDTGGKMKYVYVWLQEQAQYVVLALGECNGWFMVKTWMSCNFSGCGKAFILYCFFPYCQINFAFYFFCHTGSTAISKIKTEICGETGSPCVLIPCILVAWHIFGLFILIAHLECRANCC